MADKKKQPEWCNYPDVTRPFWGCNSLTAGLVTGENYCKDCDDYKK